MAAGVDAIGAEQLTRAWVYRLVDQGAESGRVYGQAGFVSELVFEQVFGGGAAANIADAYHQYIVKHGVCDLNRSLSR